MLNGKKIVLGVTGSIAAYKSVLLLREFIKAGADVHVIMTRSAKEFVTPLTFKTLTGHHVLDDMFADNSTDISHIKLEDDADIFVVAPATSNVIGKFASGVADDFISTFYLATTAPLLIAPAMNCNMYRHSAVQENIARLKERGVVFVGPASGELACKKEDIGRLSNVGDIFEAVCDILTKKTLTGKKVLVTAGPTVEDIDPVRFISNRSSGKMGFSVAKIAKRSGAEVTLVSGPVELKPPKGVNTVNVRSAEGMFGAVTEHYQKCDILIMAAACADFTAEIYSAQKIKKKGAQNATIALKRTVDILSEVTKEKGDRIVVGFAAESENLTDNALKKLRDKNLDFIVANNITDARAGFGGDTNVVTIIDNNNRLVHHDIMTKDELAEEIIRKIGQMLEQ